MDRPTVSVVIPAYNEARTLASTVRSVKEAFTPLCARLEVLVVDDGSRDGTGPLADDLAARDPAVRALHHPRNRGLGAAVRTGLAAAALDWIALLPADGQIPPGELAALVGEAADVVTTRFARRHDGVGRDVLSAAMRALAWALFGRWEPNTGAYLIRRSVLREIPLAARTFFVNLELPIRAAAAGRRVVCRTIEMRPRAAGRSRVLRPGRVAEVAWDVIRARVGWGKRTLAGR